MVDSGAADDSARPGRAAHRLCRYRRSGSRVRHERRVDHDGRGGRKSRLPFEVFGPLTPGPGAQVLYEVLSVMAKTPLGKVAE